MSDLALPAIRPSSLPALAKCPRYSPDQTESTQQKDDGSRRHEVFRRALDGDDSALDSLPGDEREGVEWAINYVRLHAPMADYPLELERDVVFAGPSFELVRGRADVICGPWVADLKWREGVEDNEPQMAAYALPVAMVRGVAHVHVLYAHAQRARILRFTEEEARSLVFGVIERANNPESKPSACSYCGWCKHRLTCPAVADEVRKAAAAPDPSTVTTAEEMGAMLKTAEIVREWADAVKKRAMEMALKEGIVPAGFVLRTRRGNREVSSVQSAFAVAGIPQDKFLSLCKVSFASLVEAYCEFHGVARKHAEQALETKLGDALTRRPSTQYLQAE